MPYQPKSKSLKTSTGAEITSWGEQILEPAALAETNGTALELRYTPTGSPAERWMAAQRRGPSGRVRLETSTNGTVWTTFPADGVLVGGTVGVELARWFRAVALPHGTTDNTPVVMTVWIERAGIADVLAVP